MTTTFLAHAGGAGWDELLLWAFAPALIVATVLVMRRVLEVEKQWEIEDDIADQLRGIGGDTDLESDRQ
jgi:hypothetical protein